MALRRLPLILFFISLAGLSVWLMWHTFSYDSVRGALLISAKVWSDFGSHIPLIRSFSYGTNWPPQYPLFPGEPIRYHFLFYAFVGLLEKLGLRLDYALNIPGAASFFSLCLMIFVVAKKLFIRTGIAVLSVIFFLFNGSLSFLDFLSAHPLNPSTPLQIISNSVFPSFGPWNGNQIAAFWNLNVYTNQRHLSASFAIVLLIIYLLYSHPKKLIYLVGFLTGLLLLFNQAAFAIVLPFIVFFFLLHPRLRLPLIVSFLGFIPWVVFSLHFTHTIPVISLKPGFLMNQPLTLLSFLNYWFMNLGLHLFLIPIGLLLAPRRTKIFVIPLIILFILPNIFQFSVDMINNHKFFNFYLIFGCMFTAYMMHIFWSHLGIFGKIISPLVIIALILGGVVDLFPVINDVRYRLSDYPANPDVAFFVDHTPPNSVVLNSTWFYHPASLAGRPVFNGYSYFTWSYGYNQTLREHRALSVYSASSKLVACKLLSLYHISYVELNTHPENFIHPNPPLWQNEFIPVYSNHDSGVSVYSVADSCI